MLIDMVKRGSKWVAAPVAAVALPSVSMAADHTAAITSAFTDANGNVTAAVLGIIALAAIMTGVGLIVGVLRR